MKPNNKFITGLRLLAKESDPSLAQQQAVWKIISSKIASSGRFSFISLPSLKLWTVAAGLTVVVGLPLAHSYLYSANVVTVSVPTLEEKVVNDKLHENDYRPNIIGEVTDVPPAERLAEQSAKLCFESEDVAQAFINIKQVVTSLDGYILASRLYGGEFDSAAIEVRIPAAKFAEAMRELEALPSVKVTEETILAVDKQNDLNQLEVKLGNLDKQISEIQNMLASEQSATERTRLTGQLQNLQKQKTTAESEIDLIKAVYSYATMEIEITEASRTVSFSTNFVDLRYSLEYILVFWAQLIAFLAPALGLGWFGLKMVRKMRRKPANKA